MKRSRSTTVAATLALIVIAAAAIHRFSDIEFEERRVYDPENRQLRVERLHITERWLDRQGRAVEELKTLQFLGSLPTYDQTLIIPFALDQYSRLEARELQQWVLRGGHLVAIAPFDLGAPGQAFDLNAFGITSCRACLTETLDKSDSEESEGGKSDDEAWLPGPSDRVVVTGLDARPLRLWSEYALDTEGDPDKLKIWRSRGGAAMVARYAYGDGDITLLPANAWLENEQMIEADHARLALALVDQRGGTVYLQHYNVPGGLLSWLWRQAPWFWVALLALAAFWVWSRLPRLGAPLADPDRLPNQMRERLRATARFDWRHNQGRELMDALREEISVKAQRRYPDWHRLARAERVDRLRQLCPALDPSAIQSLLEQTAIEPPDRLIEHLGVQRQLIHAL
jgi:hypothetical protein